MQSMLDQKYSQPKTINFASHVKDHALNLNDSRITDKEVPALVEFLKHHPEIKKVNLTRNAVGVSGVALLAKVATLTELNLSYNTDVGPDGAAALAKNTTLKRLFLNGCHIGNAGAIALHYNTTLVTVGLSGNQIDHTGAAYLARNVRWKSLDLSGNNVGKQGAQGFAIWNKTLESLDLSMNNLESGSVVLFAGSKNLLKLGLKGNFLGDEDYLALFNDRQVKIEWEGNQISSELITTSAYKFKTGLFKAEQLDKSLISGSATVTTAKDTKAKRYCC